MFFYNDYNVYELVKPHLRMDPCGGEDGARNLQVKDILFINLEKMFERHLTFVFLNCPQIRVIQLNSSGMLWGRTIAST